MVKSSLIIISNLSFVDNRSRALICGLILYAYFYLFSKKQPMRVDAINKGEMYAFTSFIFFLFFGVFCYENANFYLFMVGLIFAAAINIWIFFYLMTKILQNIGKTVNRVIIVFKEKLKKKLKTDLEVKDLSYERRRYLTNSINLYLLREDSDLIDTVLLKRSETIL